MTTPLAKILAAQIAAQGPMTIADYMAACLFHPEHGYYSTEHPFGAQGDFITAPDISQMFGELIGLCLAQTWMDQGAPDRITLAELGPGNGTLMSDILRVAKSVPGFAAASDVHFVEASQRLRKRQAQAVPTATWHDSAQDLPTTQPLFLVANEFFDALPIRQFQRDPKGWRERQVGLASAGTDDAADPTLSIGLSAPSPIASLDHRLEDTSDGDLIETCPSAGPIMASIAQIIETRGGAALIFDYGDWRAQGDTLQALKSHAPIDPVALPGQSDLTAHVDFEALVQNLACKHARITPQGVFLERLGITPRAAALAKNLTGAALDSHIAAHRRLTHPDEMGTLFKALALFPSNAAPPPGFEL
jgi:NADH dehydrogenase [ubiquinone] 1 alpha subcomplex assembly factor 7